MERFSLDKIPIIISIVVTAEEIPSSFLEGFEYNNISFSRLQSETLDYSRS